MITKTSKWWYLLPVFASILMYDQVLTFKEHDGEIMDMPMTVGYLLDAYKWGIPAQSYFESDPVFSNVKAEDSAQLHDYARGRMKYYYFSMSNPVLAVAYISFVKIWGVTPQAIALYGFFWSLMALLVLGIITHRMYGVWVSVLSMLFLVCNLSWLIHMKVVGWQWHISVILLMLIVYALREYNVKRVGVVGILLGLLYLVGWIGIVCAGLVLLVAVVRQWRRKYWLILDFAVLAGTFIVTVMGITLAYAKVFGLDMFDFHLAVLDTYTRRLDQGAVPGIDPNILDKLIYALRCMFVDAAQIDHADKYLAGVPAISAFFGLSFAGGLLLMLKNRTKNDLLILIWLSTTFALIALVYLYAHRYALLMLPAMAIIAAYAVASLCQKYKGCAVMLIVLCFCYDLNATFQNYYYTYLDHKAANFEVDRMRGHAEFAKLIDKYEPDKTLFVFGDQVTIPSTCFMFNTFGKPYRFRYMKPEYNQEWEYEQLSSYDNIVYLFSTMIYTDKDWRHFLKRHNEPPEWRYMYNGKMLLIAFIVDGD